MLVIGIVFISFIILSILITFACCKVAGDCSRWEEQHEERIKQEYEEWKEQQQQQEDQSSCME